MITEPANPSRNATRDGAAASQLSIPTIRLPHKFDTKGTAISCSPQKKCCYDAGNEPRRFFRRRDRYNFGEPRPGNVSQCAYCQVVNLAMEKLGFHNAGVETDRFHLGYMSTEPGRLVATDAGSWWRLFSPVDDEGTLSFNPYEIPRCHWTDVDALFTDSIRFAEACLKDCLSSHKSCGSDMDGAFRPTRMVCLDAFDTGLDVRLDDNFDDASDTRYIALSYCWGGHNPQCMTTPSNLKGQMERIRWADLPATFQDTVRFARKLGIRYLWIDSMCIIQNEPGQVNQLAKDDWMRESMKMFEVYKNSYTTLAALSGRDSRAGLRTASNRSEAIPLAYLQFDQVVNETTARVATSTIPLYIQPSHPFDDKVHGNAILPSHRDRYPLLQRAWCFQERMVSPRVLFFTESEIIYQCFQDARCECGATTLHKFRPERNRKWDTARLQVAKADGGPPYDKIETVDQGWRDVVATSYAPLHLSFGHDRLPALGAMAQKFQILRPNEHYMAGLWSGSLWLDLLWYCRLNFAGMERKLVLNRPYPVPTWSWASLPSQISYEFVKVYFDTAVIQISEAYCTYLQSPGFGALKSSVLMVRGWTVPCRMERTDEWNVDFWHLQDGKWVKYVPKVGGDFMFFEDCDDTGYQILHQGEELCLLEVARGKRSGIRGYLLLRCQDQEKNIFTRAGVAWLQVHRESTVEIGQEAGYFDLLFERKKVMKRIEIR